MRVRQDQAIGHVIEADDSSDPEGLRLANRFLRHLTAAQMSPNTVVAYARDIVHLLDYLSNLDIAVVAFTPSCAQEFFVHLVNKPVRIGGKSSGPALVVGTEQPMRKRAATSVNRTMAAISSFYEFAIVTGTFEQENPIKKIDAPDLARVSDRHQPFMGGGSRQRPVRRALRVRTVRRLPRPVSEGDLNLLLSNIRSLRDQAIFLVMLDGGLRPGEVLGLRIPDDIEYGARRIFVRHRDDHPKGVRQKSRSERSVDLLEPRTLQIVSRYVVETRPRDMGSPYLFLIGQGRRRGEPMSYQALQRSFRRLTKRLEIYTPTLTPHALRHTHATAMWENGMRELTLQKRLGHASPESTRAYTQVSDAAVLYDYKRATERTIERREK